MVAGTADRVAEDFARANRDPSNWGLAKASLTGAGAGAVPDLPATTPVDRAPPAGGLASKKAVAARRRKRKAARVARKRSRR